MRELLLALIISTVRPRRRPGGAATVALRYFWPRRPAGQTTCRSDICGGMATTAARRRGRACRAAGGFLLAARHRAPGARRRRQPAARAARLARPPRCRGRRGIAAFFHGRWPSVSVGSAMMSPRFYVAR